MSRISGLIVSRLEVFVHPARLVVFSIAFLVAPLATAAELFAGWDKTDYTLLATALTVSTLDWGQTRYIARHPQQYHELNPILGTHPSTGDVDRYFVASLAGTVVIATLLPAKYRKLYLGAVTVVEVGFVVHNHQIGIRAEF